MKIIKCYLGHGILSSVTSILDSYWTDCDARWGGSGQIVDCEFVLFLEIQLASLPAHWDGAEGYCAW